MPIFSFIVAKDKKLMTLLELVNRHDAAAARAVDLAIIGTAKNVGKTTTLNWLLEQLALATATLGLTSQGRDGEEFDAITNLRKPRIIPPAGTLVATAERLAKPRGTHLFPVAITPFCNALGRIGIYRVVEPAPIEVAGPVTVAQLRAVCTQLRHLGANRILLDGAIDRKAAAQVAPAVILSSGLAMLTTDSRYVISDRNNYNECRISEIVQRTAAVIRMLALPTLPPPLAAFVRNSPERLETGALLADGSFLPWPGSAILEQGESLLHWLPSDALALVLPGALTDGVAHLLLRSGRSDLKLVVPDGTHVLCSQLTFAKLANRGWYCYAMNSITVLAVTSNPTAPYLPAIPASALLATMRATLTLPVYDIVYSP
ncbi:MAG: hypothetical protein HY692_04825 [Cyanobacteria bacterium NC_groundwater_1444_Ag_S-0.65um_54_12]|nr:hypothetical protein [Cyanobacteria bacterium NC_groundwater_1444_Ag_S-0.65um_54_12]